MHKILLRQVKRYYGSLESFPSEHLELLGAVSKTYSDYDKEYALVERSLSISSEELQGANKKMQETILKRTAELLNERQKLASVTEHMDEGAMLISDHGQVLFYNRSMREILNFKEDSQADILEDFFEKFKEEGFKEKTNKCAQNSEPEELFQIEVGDNIYDIFFRCVEEEKRGGARNIVGTLVFVRDVTEEALFERSKSELIAVASHQLRTPLTAIRGNVEMLVDESFGKLNNEQRELLQDVEISSIRLIGMVNDMLDITKIEKKNLDLEFEEFDLEEIVIAVLNDLKDYIKQHNFSIDYQAPQQNPRIYADRTRTRQVFQNIIDNAIKYSRSPGKLTITYKVSEKVVEIILQDNGIGIPASEQSKIFGRFYRASNTSVLASSGSGLGLYIVKSVIEIMNGLITFDSKENNGTTFSIKLPTKKGVPIQ